MYTDRAPGLSEIREQTNAERVLQNSQHSKSTERIAINRDALTSIQSVLSPENTQLLQTIAQVTHRTELENQQRVRKFFPFMVIAALTISLIILTVLFIKSRSAGMFCR